MKEVRVLVAASLALALASAQADVRDSPTERVFGLPSGSPGLVLKRQDWVITREQRRLGDTAVYYMLTSESSQLNLSLYIDRSSVCSAAAACLQEALKNPVYRDARDQVSLEAGPFKAVRFYLDQPRGAPLKQANLLAAAYVDGLWFDVHISKAGAERPDMRPLVDLLNSLEIH